VNKSVKAICFLPNSSDTCWKRFLVNRTEVMVELLAWLPSVHRM